jgi:hypothetical protein
VDAEQAGDEARVAGRPQRLEEGGVLERRLEEGGVLERLAAVERAVHASFGIGLSAVRSQRISNIASAFPCSDAGSREGRAELLASAWTTAAIC